MRSNVSIMNWKKKGNGELKYVPLNDYGALTKTDSKATDVNDDKKASEYNINNLKEFRVIKVTDFYNCTPGE